MTIAGNLYDIASHYLDDDDDEEEDWEDSSWDEPRGILDSLWNDKLKSDMDDRELDIDELPDTYSEDTTSHFFDVDEEVVYLVDVENADQIPDRRLSF